MVVVAATKAVPLRLVIGSKIKSTHRFDLSGEQKISFKWFSFPARLLDKTIFLKAGLLPMTCPVLRPAELTAPRVTIWRFPSVLDSNGITVVLDNRLALTDNRHFPPAAVLTRQFLPPRLPTVPYMDASEILNPLVKLRLETSLFPRRLKHRNIPLPADTSHFCLSIQKTKKLLSELK